MGALKRVGGDPEEELQRYQEGPLIPVGILASFKGRGGL